ncbi:MAG: histidine phosphatase family protein [Firmicutes bacterium]|nr:histidine phosphatase family protein [Bacillota bacterium]
MSGLTRVYLARHGRTAWNREEIFRGRTDVPLDDLGREQARALGKHLARTGIGIIVSSPLARALETARIACACWDGDDPRVDAAFTDLSFGEWEGLSRGEVEERYPDLYRRWATDPASVTFPGGESLARVEERAWPALQRLAEAHAGEAVLVVTHRVVCKVLLAQALGAGPQAFWRIRQDTACLNVLEWRGNRVEVVTINDTCHLRSLEADRTDF